jgi:2-oxo-3-hexenedioate decarboxylase
MNQSQIEAYAQEMVRLADSASLEPPITNRDAAFSVWDAYAVALEVMARRERAGWHRVGRKIGFTNRTIWDQYGVYEPIFGYMYEETVRDLSPFPLSVHGEGDRGGEVLLSLEGLVQPRIEPEIVFGLRATPSKTDDPVALLGAIEWVGHGYEIVQCHFPGWKFTVADTIADGGLHGRYVIGPRFAIEPGTEQELAEQLSSFTITLLRDDEPVAQGGGDLVLGSPLKALRHLVEVLEGLPAHPRLEAGEIVTTGTLTTALPIAPGESWSTRIEGLGLPGFAVRFV